MISLEQIRTLETKVHKAVSMLTAVQEENQLLRSKLGTYENRIEELEFMIEEFKEDQSEIEQGIISALNHLDHLEDAVGDLKIQPKQSDNPIPAVTATTTPEAGLPADKSETETQDTSEATQSIPDWEVPAQQFQQPAPAQYDEPLETNLSESESEEPPVRNQQLDIF